MSEGSVQGVSIGAAGPPLIRVVHGGRMYEFAERARALRARLNHATDSSPRL